MFSSSFCVSTMNINNISLSRMSTIFCLLISISSLHKAFISLGSPLKGSPSLPWLISSQPHRSQAFPTQCSLCSHKDPRNPAACPQLIFPVAILLTQPPTGRGCKCKARNRPLCVQPPHPLHSAHSGVAEVSITAGVQTAAHYQHQGLFNLTPARLLIKQRDPLPPRTPQLSSLSTFFSIYLCLPACLSFCLSVSVSLIFPVFSFSGPLTL